MPYKRMGAIQRTDIGHVQRQQVRLHPVIRPGLRTQVSCCKLAYTWHNKAKVSRLMLLQKASSR
jgi:hypothetical protein